MDVMFFSFIVELILFTHTDVSYELINPIIYKIAR